jgi:hypothetical protein
MSHTVTTWMITSKFAPWSLMDSETQDKRDGSLIRLGRGCLYLHNKYVVGRLYFLLPTNNGDTSAHHWQLANLLDTSGSVGPSVLGTPGWPGKGSTLRRHRHVSKYIHYHDRGSRSRYAVACFGQMDLRLLLSLRRLGRYLLCGVPSLLFDLTGI